MGISVQTNYASLVTQNTLQSTNASLSKSLEKLSTGFRINSAADDAAGLQIANRLNLQSRGLNVAMRNSQDAISMMQTAEGAMEEMTNIAYRMNDLATQAANGTVTSADREAMNTEYGQLGAELQNIYNNSNFGGRSLLAGADSFTSGQITFQIGSTASETLDVNLAGQLSAVGNTLGQFDILSDISALKSQAESDYQSELDLFAATAASATTTSGLSDGTDFTASGTFGSYTDYSDLKAKADAGVGTAVADLTAVETAAAASVTTEIVGNTDGNYVAGASGVALGTSTYASVTALSAGLTDQASATAGMATMATFIDDLGAARAQFGANINRLDHTITNLGNMTENLEASKGRIMDTDFASESGNMSKAQMLMQSGASMLSASKMVPQLAMSLLG
ncbi:hypothetical protein MD535_01000 [Vibrio sp. ZSDZ65]|uniref:Flagellin n=1 Tax=Vibrio qingdaonensis TaxID=2829491 RepID=A0A9X3CJS3_9VIBR|nr:flagellin [Vibrio qingdaonensis]MCW8344606.1 hypothetical protein [Vibrio qingdaonensis]